MIDDLIAKRDALDAEIAKVKAAAKAGNVAKVKALMADLEVSAADLGRKPERATNGKHRAAAPMYRNDITGETWSGRGKTARWLRDAIAAGRDKAEFRIAA